MRRGVFCPGAIEIHCANRLSSSTTVSAQSFWPAWRASTSVSFVCGLCTPVQPPDLAFGESTTSGASWPDCASEAAETVRPQASANSSVARRMSVHGQALRLGAQALHLEVAVHGRVVGLVRMLFACCPGQLREARAVPRAVEL